MYGIHKTEEMKIIKIELHLTGLGLKEDSMRCKKEEED